ncbi:efflux RND transporter permease subunit [Nannocystis bainbridge]|uniref:CusA/CzcA family heavy metal efflux RND transporter n=1 Tax=Nannocystis bainbridge TaxID=2995303 RepID=A0ABT5DVK2_9BACT|nr:CusA/CzcA family heavy metal efflux RND transporter [Nannocystis bainbridge]MDC0716446.1 CusA/CzcA family heavy metal efflux RND transporter [Nannocystis bainbridge]
MIEALVQASVVHRRAVILITLVATLFAAIVATGLRFDALPDVTTNQVLVLTRAHGLTPEEVERLVTRPIEISLGGIPGMVKQRSVSRYGISSITAVFGDDVSPFLARQMVQERLALVGDRLPEDVESPELGPLSGGLGEIFHFTVRSPDRTPAELLELVELRLVPLLRAIEGVVEVNTWGGEKRTLDVVGRPEAMARWRVTLGQLEAAVVDATGTAAGASLADGTHQVLLRGVARPTTPQELGSALVRPAASGEPGLRLADVADVRWGSTPRIGAATSNGGGETVYVMVQMLRGANALQVMERLHARMADVTATLPEDVAVDVVYDRSKLVSATLATVAKNLLEGGLLVIVVLFAMLGSFRAGLLVALVIPLSMVFALAGMALLDIPGNLMSLGAIDFGLLVDGAVVMVEAVFCGAVGASLSPARIADLTRGVARPVFFSVLVILLVYVPIVTLTGVDGKMFRPMAATVIMALLAALILALTFIPAAAATVLRSRDIPAREPLLVRLAEHAYAPVLRLAARFPMLVAASGLAALAVGVWLFGRTGAAFVPQLDEGDLVIQTERAPDISIESAVREATALEQVLLEAVPEVRAVVGRIGSPAVATDLMGIEQADMFVELAPKSQWRPGLDKDALVEEIDALLAARAPADVVVFTQPIQMRFNELLGGTVTDVSLSIFGDDLAQLRELAEQAAEVIEAQPGAVDVRIMAPPDVAVAEVRPRMLAAGSHGMSAADVLRVVQAIRTGITASHTYVGPLRLPVRVRLGEPPQAALLAQVPVPTPDGALIALHHLATVEQRAAASLVNHDDAQRRIVVGFNVRGAALGDVVEALKTELAARAPLPRGTRSVWGGQYESLAEARARLAWVIPVVIAGIFAVLLLAFRRLRPAVLIFTHVPFACVGGIVALTLRGLPLSLSAAIGFIALSGIAVLNGVVLLAQIDLLTAQGHGPRRAALDAAASRMRPVLMTALVAALGFVPMMLATGTGAEVQRPLATVVVGGLLTSTLLTLVILPALYPFFAGRAAGGER